MLRAIIFDVGGVLIRTHNRTGRQKWAARLGIEAWEFEHFVFDGESGQQAQLGHKTSEAHWRWLGDYFGVNEVDLSQMRQDFFAGDALDESLLEYVGRLRSAGYRTGLLSNAGDNARQLLSNKHPILNYFDGVVISAEVGLMKPDPKIYGLAAERVGVKTDEALLVDDFIENIDGAKAVGMQALHFTDPDAAQQQLVEITGVA